MKTFICNKCNSTDLFTKEKGTSVGLYCSDCGRWIKWLGKEELRLFERYTEMNKINLDVVMEVEEPEEEISLSIFSDEELLNEIKRRMR